MDTMNEADAGEVFFRVDLTHCEQISAELRRRISSGYYRSGVRMPAERELALEFGCSRLTLSKALGPLAAEGLVVRQRGRGTFVSNGFGKALPGRRPSGRGNIVKYNSPGRVGAGVSGMRDDVLTGLIETLRPAGRHISVDFYSGAEECARCLRESVDGQVAGVVLWPFPSAGVEDAVRRLEGSGVPVVLIDTYLPGLKCDYAVSDNAAGAASVVRYLAGKGHRRIAYVTRIPSRTSIFDRLGGVLAGFVECGIGFSSDDVVVVSEEEERDSGLLWERIRGKLSEKSPPSVFFASNDSIAFSIKEILEKNGYSVPGDVSLAGYDGILSSGFSGLVTVCQDFYGIAVEAGRIMLERFEKSLPAIRYQSRIFPRLVAGSSVSVHREGA